MPRPTKTFLTAITALAAAGLSLAAASRATDYTVAGGVTQALATDLGGADTLTKQGAGTLQVTVNQSFSGDITLGDGTLILYGNAAAATTVNGGLLMLGGTTGQPITLNAGTLRIGAQRSIPWTSISGSNTRRLIGTAGGNADFDFGSPGTFYTTGRAQANSQSQTIVDAGLPESGLVTDVSNASRAFQFRIANSGVNASRITSHEGGADGANTAYISVPAASQKNYVEVQALLGTSALPGGTMDFAGYARYSDAPSNGVSIGGQSGIPLYTATAGAGVAVSVGRYDRDTLVYSTDPIHLYARSFNVDPTKTLTAVGMLRSGNNTNQGGYFALSGLAVNDASTAFTSDITVAGSATLDLSGAAISGGTATLTGQALNLSGGTLTLTRSLGAARDYAATFTGGTVSVTTGLVVNSPGSLTISGPLTGAGSLTKTGDGVLTLSGSNTFGSGTLTFGGGTTNVGYLRAANSNAFGGHTTVALASDQGGISGIQLTGGVTIPQNLTTEGRQNQTTTGYILRNLAGNNAWNGSITIVDTGGGYGILSDAGTLTIGGNITSTQTGLSTRRGVTFAGAGDIAVTGGLVKGGTTNDGRDLEVIMSGTGRLTLSGTNDYGGSTTVSSGVLSVQSVSALGATSIGTTVSGGAALEITGGIVTAAEPLSLSGTGVATGGALRNVSGTNTFAGPITLAAASRINSDAGQLTLSAASLPLAFELTVGGAGDTVIQSAVSGAGAFVKGGTGTVALAGANSFGSGTLTLGGGTANLGYLKLTNDAALGSHATLRLNSTQTTGVSGVQLEGGVTISQTLETRGRGNTDTTGYVIRNISGSNAWNGAVTIVDGGGSYGFIADAGTLTLGGTVSSSYVSSFASRGLSFSGAGDFAVTGNVIATGPNSQDLNVSMNGTGRLALSGTNTYGGATTVSTGTLLISGNSSAATGAVSVAQGATLGGTGTVGGATTVSGIHSPGASPGLQTFVNGLVYASTSTLVWELSANTAASAGRGVLYDGIDLTTGGALAIDPAATLSLVFNAPQADATPSNVAWTDPFWDENRQWMLVDVAAPVTWDSGLFGTLAVGLDSVGASLGSVRPDASFAVVNSGGDVTLQYVAVPEPASLTIVAAGLAAAGGLQLPRRRR